MALRRWAFTVSRQDKGKLIALQVSWWGQPWVSRVHCRSPQGATRLSPCFPCGQHMAGLSGTRWAQTIESSHETTGPSGSFSETFPTLALGLSQGLLPLGLALTACPLQWGRCTLVAIYTSLPQGQDPEATRSMAWQLAWQLQCSQTCGGTTSLLRLCPVAQPLSQTHNGQPYS